MIDIFWGGIVVDRSIKKQMQEIEECKDAAVRQTRPAWDLAVIILDNVPFSDRQIQDVDTAFFFRWQIVIEMIDARRIISDEQEPVAVLMHDCKDLLIRRIDGPIDLRHPGQESRDPMIVRRAKARKESIGDVVHHAVGQLLSTAEA